MSHEGSGGGGVMALRTGHPQTAGPLGDEDHLGEILVRLLPLPSLLVRASAISRQWGRLVMDQAFFRILDAPIRSLASASSYASGTRLVAVADVRGPVHGDYHSGPFNVVLVATRWRHPVLARVYSLETGEGEIFP